MTTPRLVYTIGVGVFIRNGNTILVGKRGPKCLQGRGCYALPGGYVEGDESILVTALREVTEETGLKVKIVGGTFSVAGLLAVTDHNDIHQQRDGQLRQHLSLWIMSQYIGGVPEVKEPDKCEGWEWRTLQDLAKQPGCDNPTHPQYFWTPMPLWRQILLPYFGQF